MGKKPTPPPDPRARLGCALILGVIAFAGVALAVIDKRYWPLVFAIPIGMFAYRYISEKLLLYLVAKSLKHDGFIGLLPTSDSPHWKAYIENKWIRSNENAFQILNWSQHAHWRKTIYTKAFYRFCDYSRELLPIGNFVSRDQVSAGVQILLCFQGHQTR